MHLSKISVATIFLKNFYSQTVIFNLAQTGFSKNENIQVFLSPRERKTLAFVVENTFLWYADNA